MIRLLSDGDVQPTCRLLSIPNSHLHPPYQVMQMIIIRMTKVVRIVMILMGILIMNIPRESLTPTRKSSKVGQDLFVLSMQYNHY